MAKTITTAGDHLDSSTVPTTVMPLTMVVWGYLATVSNFLKIFTIGAASNSASYFSLCIDQTGNTTRASATVSKTGTLAQARTNVSPTAASWNHYAGVFNSSVDIRGFFNGANKVTNVGLVPDTTVNSVILTGRSGDYAFHIGGQVAHAAVWTRALTDTEIAYLGTGGNPRAIKGCVAYWEIGSAESPVADQIGVNNLTVTGTSAGTSAPDVETFMTGGPITDKSYTQGTAIPQIDLTAGGGIFDDVASPYTITRCQLGAPTAPTATTQSGTNLREFTVGSVSGISADNYVKIAGNALPTRVLGTNVTAGTILVADDQTFATNASVQYYTVNPLSIAGLSLAGNKDNGTPTVSGTFNLCLYRATCNNNASVIADSNLHNIVIAASGGGGGGTALWQIAGSYSGGFSGG